MKEGIALKPVDFRIEKVYPNPFNSNVRIDYRLGKLSDVAISVFDLSGRRITNDIRKAVQAGVHSYSYDASALPSGIYMVRMRAGAVTRTVKIVCVK